MPQNLVIMKLFDNQLVTPNYYEISGIIKMRDYVRIESIWCKATSVEGTPKYTLEWAGGIQEDQFQDWAANDDLCTNVVSEQWQVLYPPDFKAPYVKFKLSAHVDSQPDSRHYVYAYVREDFA